MNIMSNKFQNMKKKIKTLIVITLLLVSCTDKSDLNIVTINENKEVFNVDLMLIDSETGEVIKEAKTDFNGAVSINEVEAGSYILVAKNPNGTNNFSEQLREVYLNEYLLESCGFDFNSQRSIHFKTLDQKRLSLLTGEESPKDENEVIKIENQLDSISKLIYGEDVNKFPCYTDPILFFTTFHFIQIKNSDPQNITLDLASPKF